MPTKMRISATGSRLFSRIETAISYCSIYTRDFDCATFRAFSLTTPWASASQGAISCGPDQVTRFVTVSCFMSLLYGRFSTLLY